MGEDRTMVQTNMYGFWHESGFALYHSLEKAREEAQGDPVYRVYLDRMD